MKRLDWPKAGRKNKAAPRSTRCGTLGKCCHIFKRNGRIAFEQVIAGQAFIQAVAEDADGVELTVLARGG
jgi:hypothetical protein